MTCRSAIGGDLKYAPGVRGSVLPAIAGGAVYSLFAVRRAGEAIEPQEPLQSVRKLFRIERIKIGGHATAYLSVGGDIGDRNRTAASHRLEWRKAETFIDRRIDKTLRARIQDR